MCLFFESIKVKEGKAFDLDLHEERMNRTRRDLLGLTHPLSLEQEIQTDAMGLCKCRIVYRERIEKVEIIPYSPKKIEFLKIVVNNDIQYGYKYLDRSCFEKMMENLPPITDILIVKDGFITDTSFANIIFHDSSKWVTPSTPLLPGIKRERLLRQGIIHEQKIKLQDLSLFRSAKIINAMLDPEDSHPIDIRNISASMPLR
jgi:4-amino-4-deoxychorismate lyase